MKAGVAVKVEEGARIAPIARPAQSQEFRALTTESVPVADDCVGDRWTIRNEDQLAKLVAVIAMGQALHATKIIRELQPAAPAITHTTLLDAAKRQVQVSGQTKDQQDAARWRRDGFLFEAISWIAARQSAGPRTYLRDPHLKSTTQGIDGLMVELDPEQPEVLRATIFEDKCSDDPRRRFREEVLPAFKEHHRNARAPELVSTAALLIERSGLNETAAVEAAARVLDLERRRYRASFAVSSEHDSNDGRASLFKNYADLSGLKADQRIAATFVTGANIRDWFKEFAKAVIAELEAQAKLTNV